MVYFLLFSFCFQPLHHGLFSLFSSLVFFFFSHQTSQHTYHLMGTTNRFIALLILGGAGRGTQREGWVEVYFSTKIVQSVAYKT